MGMRRFGIVLVQVCSMLFFQAQADVVCYTPDGRFGQCINFRKCDYMVQLIQQWSTTKDQNLYNTIWASVCNYASTDPDVCCPLPSTPLNNFNSGSSSSFIFSPLNTNGFTNGITFVNYNFNYNPETNGGGSGQCGVSLASQTRVIGGRDAPRNAYPWIAALIYLTDGLRQLCGGALITRRHVVTAAHCIKDSLHKVRLGAHELSNANDGISFDIEWRRRHESYVGTTILNDIGMIKITIDAPIGDTIRPICLPSQEPERSMDYTGYTPFVAGWGSTEDDGPASNILQEVQVPVVTREDCEYNYKLYFPQQVFDDRVICAGSTGKDSCQGDSGGPLMLPVMNTDRRHYYFILIGIVSYGFQCGVAGFPGVYTRVSTFLPWIEQNIKN